MSEKTCQSCGFYSQWMPSAGDCLLHAYRRRAMILRGDTVLTPFLGIGSEAVSAIKLGRRAVGAELKGSYFSQAVKNVAAIEAELEVGDLFNPAGGAAADTAAAGEVVA